MFPSNMFNSGSKIKQYRPALKGPEIINVSEGVKEREPSYTVSGNVNWCSHYGKQYGGSSKK